MRPYGQHCAAARALDVIGDRWSLLIVRELLLRDCRFAELADGLPGIATNLLTERLRSLEHAGVLERFTEPPPGRTVRYRLTTRGRELAPVLRALMIWGAPLIANGAGEDAVRGRWVTTAADALFHDIYTNGLPALHAILHANHESVRLLVEPGQPIEIAVCTGQPTDHATVEVWADQPTMIELLLGAPTEADITGDEPALNALIAKGRGRQALAHP